MNMHNNPEIAPLVVIVDDDDEIRLALAELLESVGIASACFGSTQELFESEVLEEASCLILDVRMPGSSGLDLQQSLAAEGYDKPVIFLTGHGDIPMSVQAMKAGAIDFLTKPVRDQTLIDAVTAGIAQEKRSRAEANVIRELTDRFASLTPREKQVMRLVSLGRLNKQVAYELGITDITVKLHRSNVMRKMAMASVGELIRAWEKLPAELRESLAA